MAEHSDENLEHRDEEVQRLEEHSNSSCQEANQHVVKFTDELRSVNE